MTGTLPPTSPSVPYSKVRSELGTGDLVFLHGTSPAGVMIEQLEEGLGWPPFSHIGMVIKDGVDLYLWDAPGGGDCFPDPYAGDPDNRIYGDSVHTGCRVSVLDDVLAYYATKVDVPGFWIRQLTSGVTDDRFQALRRFINRVDGQPFPAGPGTDPAVTGLGANFLAGQDRASVFFGTYFCAQLVADSYMHMGLLAMEDFPANGYSPAAFDMTPSTRLPLVKPATLGNVFFVDWDRPTGSGTPCNQ
jgi:hypothetical protein